MVAILSGGVLLRKVTTQLRSDRSQYCGMCCSIIGALTFTHLPLLLPGKGEGGLEEILGGLWGFWVGCEGLWVVGGMGEL